MATNFDESGSIKRENTPGVDVKVEKNKGTRSEILKTPTQGSIPYYAGDYELQTLTLTSPNRKGYIDLKAAWSEFNIYEDIFADCLTANIRLVDGIGLMESVPIIGEETINIK